MSDPALFLGEDYIVARCTAAHDIQAIAASLRSSGQWDEVVPGMSDLTVKYDPLLLSLDDARQNFLTDWHRPAYVTTLPSGTILLDADFEAAPDRNDVAAALGLLPEALPAWLCARHYRVVMMGFQPGFAYLEDLGGDALPAVSRLATPRSFVAAGSIGFLGKRLCIYALDGPGGWPIIGQVCAPLFRRDDAQPFLLQPGQTLRFRGS